MTRTDDDIALIALEIAARPEQVRVAIDILNAGSEVPFIERYQTQVTDGLDEEQLHHLEERLTAQREFQTRRKTILESIKSQGKLTRELATKIGKASTSAALEGLYQPYASEHQSKEQSTIDHDLTKELAAKTDNASTRAALEVLYQPYEFEHQSTKQSAVDRDSALPNEASSTNRSNSLKTMISNAVGKGIADTEPAARRQDIPVEQLAETSDPSGPMQEDLTSKTAHDGWRVKQRKAYPSAEPEPHYVKSASKWEQPTPCRDNQPALGLAPARSHRGHNEKAQFSPNMIKPAATQGALPKLRSWRLQTVCWLTGMSAALAAAALVLIPELGAGLDGKSQVARLNQLLAQFTMKTTEPEVLSVASDEQNVTTAISNDDRPVLKAADVETDLETSGGGIASVANASTLSEPALVPEMDEVPHLPAPSSSQAKQHTEMALELSMLNDRNATQRPLSDLDDPSSGLHVDPSVEHAPNREQQPAEIASNEIAATSGHPHSKTEAAPLDSTSLMQGAALATYWVQVAAMRNETEARRIWAPSEQELGMVVTAMEPQFEHSETADGSFYKVQFGPFQARSEAQDLCTWLTERDSPCFVVIR